MTNRQRHPVSQLRRGVATLQSLAMPFFGACVFVAGAMLERALGPAAQRMLSGEPAATRATSTAAGSSRHDASATALHMSGQVRASDAFRKLERAAGSVRRALDEASRSLKENQILLRVMEDGAAEPSPLGLRQIQLRVEELQRKITALQRRRDELIEMRSILATRLDMSEIQQLGEEVPVEITDFSSGDLEAATSGETVSQPSFVRWDLEANPGGQR